ncbi:MAG: succinate dehydrogenase, cytochrome b556 subunit [Acidobacteriota bacterium]
MYKNKKFFDLNYYKFTGSWAWILHRLSGLALIFYLSAHIWVISTISKGPEGFNRVMGVLASPLFKVLEIGLWGVILFHAFNGIRVVLIDFWKGSLHHKKLFFIMIFIAFVLWVAGGYLIVSHM